MVGLVFVSHSQKLAEGVAELALMMAPNATVCAAGGMEDGGLGTSFDKITRAVKSISSPDGVIILMDMGSSVMTSEMVCEALPDERILLSGSPMVEGAVVAAVGSSAGLDIEEIIDSLKGCHTIKRIK